MDGKKSNYDCVRIPSATKFAIATKASDQSIKKGSGFCGNRGLVSTTGATLATVCCKHITYIELLIPIATTTFPKNVPKRYLVFI